jgi:LPS export ABC transporter protein LptC
MKRLSTLFLVVFLVLAAGLGGFVAWRAKSRKAPEPVATPPTQADYQIKEVHIDETLEGNLRWTLDADQAEVFDPQRRTVMQRVVIRVFSRDGSWTVTADRGTLENETRDVLLEGNVLVRSSDEVEIRTERLAWRNKDRLLSSDLPVRIQRAGTTITGRHLAVAMGDQRATLDENVRVVITNRANANLSIFPRSGS